MKLAIYLFLSLSIILFGIAAYYHFITFDETMHQRFMGLGTVTLMFFVIPCFLVWRYLKRQKEKRKDSDLENNSSKT